MNDSYSNFATLPDSRADFCNTDLNFGLFSPLVTQSNTPSCMAVKSLPFSHNGEPRLHGINFSNLATP